MKTPKWFIHISILVLVSIVLGFSIRPASAQTDRRPEVILLTARGPLTPAMREYIQRGLEYALQRNSELVVLQLDTPGGSSGLMDEIVQLLLNSPVPVVVYVSPAGAMAASAGTVITLAGDLAVMTPGTAIGAASPVGAEGEDLEKTIERKAKEIVRAQIREIAKDRPPEAVALAEATVEEAVAVSAEEAFEIGLVDFLAADLQSLLRQIDGVEVRTPSGTRTLDTGFITINQVEPTFMEQLLAVLTDPNIVFLLISIGVWAILIELSHPGGWVAGFVGVVSLLVGSYGLGVLPVNYLGLVLMVIAFVLFYMEISAPLQGAFGTAGAISFVAGALMLFNSARTPDYFHVSVPLVVATGAAVGLTFIAVVAFAMRAMKTPVQMGQAVLLGRSGIARSAISAKKSGSVHLGGEIWSAELVEGERSIKDGDRVEVVGVEGVRLQVRRKPDKAE
jgi:membrane-bound serine protease (ClpP class)